MGFGLVIGFNEHLQLVSTSNYNTAADLHTEQITTAHTAPSCACTLVVAPNSDFF
jgi:hypothetical protein